MAQEGDKDLSMHTPLFSGPRKLSFRTMALFVITGLIMAVIQAIGQSPPDDTTDALSIVRFSIVHNSQLIADCIGIVCCAGFLALVVFLGIGFGTYAIGWPSFQCPRSVMRAIVAVSATMWSSAVTVLVMFLSMR